MRPQLLCIAVATLLSFAAAACGADSQPAGTSPGEELESAPDSRPADRSTGEALGRDAASPSAPGDEPARSGVEATLRIGSASAAVGETVTVEVVASGMMAPGLGAWAIKVVYDPSVLSVMECPNVGTGVCNPTFDQRTVLFAGAAGGRPGLTGSATLGSITFRCESAGTSALAISVGVLADATTDSPLDMNAPVEDGEISCA